jgi:hypothetical protein
MGNLNIHRDLIFANPNEIHRLKPEKLKALEHSLQSQQSNVVFETPEGSLQRLTVDEYLQKADQLQSKGTAHLSIQLSDGRSLVVALANLSHETLSKVLEGVVTRYLTKEPDSEFGLLPGKNLFFWRSVLKFHASA